MHRKMKSLRYIVCVLLLVFFLLPLSAAALPGDASDPLVSKSWVDSYVEDTVSALERLARELIIEARELMKREIVLSPSSDVAYINNKAVQMDVKPKIVQVSGGGVTLVPLRFVGEALNISVIWDSAAKTVTCRNDEIKVVLPINGSVAMVNDFAVSLQAAPVIENGRTLVPLRFISQAFKCSVDWNSAAQKITIKNH